ncbi:enhancer of split malpha protein [Stomoxys calcitrans]|uniref:Enhancer of split malpha protein n=1 Tax=Stomoxys calcitrans TaxID=35570 RepID=A0A1I8PFS6_STOCA|nr:enhancer of split malpha protein [Stomoxys calcitrans]
MSFMTREYKFNTTLQMSKKDQHTMAMRSLRKLVKPLLRLVKKKQLMRKTLAEIQQNTYNASLEDMRKDPISINASKDNVANEALEQRLYSEIRKCPANAAVIVQQGQQQHLVPVNQQQSYIPVHFARTDSGTFFWTSMDAVQQQEMKMRSQLDRWAQA